MIRELHLYDFDGTLFRSPDIPSWWTSGYDWWMKEDSLGRPCVPDNPDGSWWVANTVDAARKSIANPDVMAIVCTGRSQKTFARWRVPELLHLKGLRFDLVAMNPGGDTPAFKKRVIDKLLDRFPDIQVVHIWEDRAEHLTQYLNHVAQRGIQSVSHLVREPAKKCDSGTRVVSRWLMRAARVPTNESQAWKADNHAREQHVNGAVRAFKSLLHQLQPYADQAIADHAGHTADEIALRGKAFIKLVKDRSDVVAYMDQWVGNDPQVDPWRKQVLVLARNYLIYPTKFPLKKVVEGVRKLADKSFEALALADSQGPLRKVIPSDLRAFLPKNIVVNVDNDGTIQQVTDRFANEHETLGKKINTMKSLVAHYNAIVRQVKDDLMTGDDSTRLAAVVTAIIMETGIRPGKEGNKVVKTVDGNTLDVETFGATTLGPEHVRIIRDDFVELEFVGKKGTTNIATLSDTDVIKILRSYVDQAKSGGSKFIFITNAGNPFSYTDLQRYFRKHFAEFSPTDFRKLRATETVFHQLRASQTGLYSRIRAFVAEQVDNLRDRVVQEIVSTVGAAYGQAQAALSHDSVDVTVNSYINPEVLLQFLSTGQVEDSLEHAILHGQQKLSFDPDVFVGRALAKTASTLTLQDIIDDLEDQIG